MRLPRKFSQTARKSFFFIHLWTGLILGLWFVVMGLTGTVLAWRSEVTSWEVRHRVGAPLPKAGEKIIPASQAIAAFKAAFPKIRPERGMYIPTDKFGYEYYRMNGRGTYNGKPASSIFIVNPVTGEAYPEVPRPTMWVVWAEDLHADLLADAKGAVANGIFSFFALFMLASGAWLWWPSNWKQFKDRLTIKRGMSLRRTLYDLHNAMGVYLFGLLFLLTLTGVVLVYDGQTEKSLTKAIDARYEAKPIAPSSGRSMSGGAMPVIKPEGEMLGVDELIEKAKVAVPGHALMNIKMPQKKTQPFQASFDPVGFNNGVVFFNPYTGAKIDFDGPTHAPGAWAMKYIGNLHYGWFGSNWSQFIYGLSGFMPLGLFITGVWMWINKKRGQARLKKKTRSGSSSPAIAASHVAEG